MLINAIEDRLWDLERAWCRSGMELHLVESRLIAYDTGERILSPRSCWRQSNACPCGLCFITCTKPAADRETVRRILAVAGDHGSDASLVAKIRRIDYYFLI